MDRVYKRSKKSTVQLTSLLDLLFVMIFVSLIQQKQVTPAPKKKEPTPVVKKEVVKEKVKPKPISEPKPKKTFFTVKATFNFYATDSNPQIPNGKYLMQGNYDQKTGKIQLGGVAWLNRPQNYDMVPLNGKINKSENSFTEKIDAIGCKTFTLTRKMTDKGSPISGEWVGKYSCSQGFTGLTLSIQ